MRPRPLPFFAVSMSLALFACEPTDAETVPDRAVFRRYTTPDALVQGTLLLETPRPGQRLSGVTQLTDETCLFEEAAIDADGRLVNADLWLSGPPFEEPTHIFLDPVRGVIELSAASRQIAWAVPNHEPWIWQPIGSASAGHTLSTPLSALVALNAAAGGRSVRSIELDSFHSYSVTADQVVVPEADAATVVLGDDAAAIRAGFPEHIHLASLGRELQVVEPGKAPALAALSCSETDAVRSL